MATKIELQAYYRRQEAITLRDAIKIVRARKLVVPGVSRALVCRVLDHAADVSDYEAEQLEEGVSDG